MKHKTIFRLMLKAVGVWLFVSGATQFVQMLGYVSFALFSRSSAGMEPLSYVILQLLAPMLEMAAAVYLFFGGKWVADKAIPSNRNYCHECGYDLSGTAGNVCAECGTPFRS